MISVSGVRGILGKSMDPEIAARFAAAYGSWLAGQKVVIGRDSRASGPALSSAVSAALRFMGIDIIDVGIAATPTVELMVRHLDADGGIIITASHNNEDWNALKFLDGKGEFIDSDAVAIIRGKVEGEEGLYSPPQRIGSYSRFDSADDIHIDRILDLECIDPAGISASGIKAVIDCVNGAGSAILPALLIKLGVDVITLYTDMNSPFPHDPEPRPANLGELSRSVRKENADIGFACDPDADRLVLVDGEGTVCSEELTLALAADFILQREKGDVVANLSSSRLIDDLAAIHGVASVRSKVGEANVISMMKDVEAVIGGEGNGGVIYPAIHYGRDAMTGAALILQLLADEKVSLKEKIASLPRYYIVKEKFPFKGSLDAVIEALKIEFVGEINGIDGIRIDMEKGWVHFRRSNTEPVVRIIAEAADEDEARRLVEKAGGILDAFS